MSQRIVFSGQHDSRFPANTGHSPRAVSMLAHRLRRWPNIETALGECPVFAGLLGNFFVGTEKIEWEFLVFRTYNIRKYSVMEWDLVNINTIHQIGRTYRPT